MKKDVLLSGSVRRTDPDLDFPPDPGSMSDASAVAAQSYDPGTGKLHSCWLFKLFLLVFELFSFSRLQVDNFTQLKEEDSHSAS